MKKIFYLLFISLLFINLVNASFISMETTVSNTVELDGSKGESVVTVVNKGDEPAYSVQFTLLDINNKVMVGQGKGVLNPGEAMEENFKLDLSNIKLPGTYPLFVFIDYKDANNYPFSAIAPSSFNYKQATNPLLLMQLTPIKLIDKTSFSFKITNMDELPKKINVRVVVPRELVVKDSNKIVDLGGKESTTLNYEISTLSALPGSTYPIFIMVSYEENGRFYSNFISSNVQITEGISIFSLPVLLGIVILIILVLIIIISQLRKKSRRGSLDF